MNTSLTYQQTAIHYNLHMLSSVCVIWMWYHDVEENELRRLYEASMLNKFGRSSNFPIDMMCLSRNVIV